MGRVGLQDMFVGADGFVRSALAMERQRLIKRHQRDLAASVW
jgi:hypothetical protein